MFRISDFFTTAMEVQHIDNKNLDTGPLLFLSLVVANLLLSTSVSMSGFHTEGGWPWDLSLSSPLQNFGS